MDIATALNKIAETIKDYIYPRESRLIDPIVLTSAIASANIVATIATGKKIQCQYVGIRVRSMGTATYIGVGTKGSENFRLTSINSYLEYEAPKNGYIDAMKIWFLADTADAVIEVTGVMMPSMTED